MMIMIRGTRWASTRSDPKQIFPLLFFTLKTTHPLTGQDEVASYRISIIGNQIVLHNKYYVFCMYYYSYCTIQLRAINYPPPSLSHRPRISNIKKPAKLFWVEGKIKKVALYSTSMLYFQWYMLSYTSVRNTHVISSF